MRCVSYTRYVSVMPEKDTPVDIISRQNDRIRSFAKKQGWAIEQKYSDRKNDKTAETAFLQMKQDGMKRQFDIVIMDSFYRFGRNISTAKNLLSEIFYPAGINFAVAEDEFCSIGKTQDELDQYFARIVIDEEVAPVIRIIFQLTADGLTMKQIAEILNEKGYESPAIHLERVSQKKRFKGHKEYWTANTVKTVSSCCQYLGKVTKKVGEDYVDYEIPQIIDAELYEKAEASKKRHFHGSPRNRAALNPFKFIIRDIRSGESLVCITNQVDRSIREFCIGRRNEDPKIPYEIVYDSVIEILKKEICQAENAASMLETEEAKELYEERRKVIVKSLRRMMRKVSEISEERIRLNNVTDEHVIEQVLRDTDVRLSELEQKYQMKLEELYALKNAFQDNPWIRMYRDIRIDEDFDDRQIRRLIETVWVRDFKYITADMMHQEWKSMLPRNWRKGESAYGAKEQEET